MIRINLALIGILSLVSCALNELDLQSDMPCDLGPVPVSFRTCVSDAAKSSISVDESEINDINIYVFRAGVLVDQAYASTAGDIVLNLQSNSTYNIYAVANVGVCRADTEEEKFKEGLSYSILDVSMLDRGMPMRSVNRNVHIGGKSQTISLYLERMAAKVTLDIERSSLLEGLQVKSVRLCQSASIVRPFKWDGQGGSRAESESETIDGDYATAADLGSLNDGGTVSFYTLENCQGILLPENVKPERKIPAMIDGKDELCSFLELECGFDDSGMLEGDVLYRIYLGLDDCTSFDVPGNACINVSLRLTGDGLKTVSWKVQADVNVRDGYVSGKVVEGMHGMSGMYVGEVLLYEVTLCDELLEYLGGDASGCSLRLICDGDEAPGIAAGTLQGQGRFLQAEVKGEAEVEGELYLYAADGQCIGLLEERVCVMSPRMMLSEYSGWDVDEPVPSLSYIPECEINGEDECVYVYFTDSDGYNLNGIRSYGFDASLFDLSDHGTRTEGKALSSVKVNFGQMPRTGGAAFASAYISCVNPGKDHDENRLLASVYAAEKPAYMTVYETNHAISSQMRVGLGVPQITLTLVDNGWAGYFSCQLSMKVDNPSNLPVDVSVWQLLATNAAYGAVDSDYVERNLQIDHLDFMTGQSYDGAPPLYGSCASFYSERNEEGDQALNDGSSLVYPLEDISTDDMLKAISYGRRGAGQMIHMVDATLAGHRILQSDIRLVDKVSDGSSRFDYIYYSEDSWNYRGAGLSSSDHVYVHPANWRHEYPNLTPGRMDRMVDRFDDDASVCISMVYSEENGRTSVTTQEGKGTQYGLDVTFEYTGTVNGYVQTHPKGTWYSAQDNWCSVDFSHTETNVPLRVAGSSVWADGGEMKSAMDRIYGYSYKDSDRPLGADSYMHHAHPVDMDLQIGLCVEGTKGNELYPFYMLWENEYLEYHHTQDAKVYKCAFNSIVNAYKLSVVRRK